MRDLKDYRIAHSVQEAVTMMRQGPGHGAYIAGGTDMFLMPEDCDFVVDINHAGIGDVARTPGGDLFIGAAATLQGVATSPLTRDFACGALAAVAGQCGNRPVRSTATLGGNLCNALPSADMAPVLLALDAVCYVADVDSQESLPLADFFVGPRRTVLDGRLLVGLAVPGEAADRRCVFRRLTRSAEDISLVQVAVALGVQDGTIDSARIALGAVAPVPLRANLAETQLAGLPLRDIDPDVIAGAAAIAAGECEPIDDHRASADYRREMVKVLTARLLARAVAWDPSLPGRGSADEDGRGGAA